MIRLWDLNWYIRQDQHWFAIDGIPTLQNVWIWPQDSFWKLLTWPDLVVVCTCRTVSGMVQRTSGVQPKASNHSLAGLAHWLVFFLFYVFNTSRIEIVFQCPWGAKVFCLLVFLCVYMCLFLMQIFYFPPNFYFLQWRQSSCILKFCWKVETWDWRYLF